MLSSTAVVSPSPSVSPSIAPPPPPPSAAAPVDHYQGSSVGASDNGETFILNVPFRSQYDDSPYQYANCGPAALGMVLEAYGLNVPTSQLRSIADQLQGTYGYDDGIALDYLQAIAQQAGLHTEGLTTTGGHYRRWSMGDVILAVRHGYPVITLVHYASLPGHATSASKSDHFIVVVGVTPQGFVINDPAYSGQDGYHLILHPSDLLAAWHDAGIQNQAAAFLPPSGHLALPGEGATSGTIFQAASVPATAAPAAPPAATAFVPPNPGPPPPPPTRAPSDGAVGPTPAASSMSLVSQAWSAALSGWAHSAPVATVRPAPPTPGGTDSTLVLAEDGSGSPSPLPAALVVVLVGGLALAIVKAPTDR